MRDIRASVEVRAPIGADKLRELHGDAFVRYECWQCGRTGRTTVPTSVIVLGYRVFRVVKLAHAGCADSQIIEAGGAAMRAVAGEPERRNTAGEPGEQAGTLAAARHPARGGWQERRRGWCAGWAWTVTRCGGVLTRSRPVSRRCWWRCS